VRIPKGEYTIEASVDSGPLAGVLENATSVKFEGGEVLP
jgi:hypothetical protein